MDTTDFSITVDFAGLATFGVTPGPWFQNGSVIDNYKNSLKPGCPDFFSEKGSLARRASQVLVGFQPTVKLKMNASDYSRVKSSWQTQSSVSGGCFCFSFGANAGAFSSKDHMHYDDASASITMGGQSALPILLGIVSSNL